MVSLGVAMPYLALALLAVALLWGSILAVRGRRWWASVMMVVGAGMQVLGAILTCGGAVWMMMGSMGRSGAASAPGMAPMLLLMGGGALSLGLGFVVFAAGFVGFSARYGATERRAAELEGLVEGLQQRIDP